MTYRRWAFSSSTFYIICTCAGRRYGFEKKLVCPCGVLEKRSNVFCNMIMLTNLQLPVKRERERDKEGGGGGGGSTKCSFYVGLCVSVHDGAVKSTSSISSNALFQAVRSSSPA